MTTHDYSTGPHPESPNGVWARLGCTIERLPKRVRVIRRPNGSVVEVARIGDEDSHDAELRVARGELKRLAAGDER